MADDASKHPLSEDPPEETGFGEVEFLGNAWFEQRESLDLPDPQKSERRDTPSPPPPLLAPGSDLAFLQRGFDFGNSEGESWVMDEDEDEDEGEVNEDTPEKAQVRKVVKAMVKAIKGTRMYPLDNPICRRFANELCEIFDHTFEMMAYARLGVGKSKIYFRGDAMIEQQGRESVPARLFWDGIREITFRQGLTKQEILEFLELFRRDHVSGGEGEDDLVTLFWEQNFEHISYMAVDDFLDLDNPNDPVPEEFGSAFLNFVEVEANSMDDDEDAALEPPNSLAQEVQKSLASGDDSELFGVSREERDAILREFAIEDSPKILDDILFIISETMYLDDNELSFCGTAAVVSGALEGLVEEGRLSVAAGLVRLLSEMQEVKEDLTPGMRSALAQGLKSGWEGASLQALVKHMNLNLPNILEGLEEFLELLPDAATAALCHVLGEITHPAARKRVVEALARKAKSGFDDFQQYLEDPRPEVLKDMIKILGETGNDRLVPHLKRLMSNPDVGVRGAALQALARLGPAKAGDVLLRALRDPDTKVRLMAVAGLGNAGRVALPMLVGIIEEKDFNERDLLEKKAFFKALGTCGGEEVIPILGAILDQKSIFKRAAQEEMKACACEALGWIGGRFAQSMLEQQANKKSVIIRSASTSALRRISKKSNDRSAA